MTGETGDPVVEQVERGIFKRTFTNGLSLYGSEAMLLHAPEVVEEGKLPWMPEWGAVWRGRSVRCVDRRHRLVGFAEDEKMYPYHALGSPLDGGWILVDKDDIGAE